MARNLKAELSHLAILYTDIIRKAGILALELYNRRCSAWQVKSIPPPPFSFLLEQKGNCFAF